MRTTHWVDGVQQPRGSAGEFWRFWMGEDSPEQILEKITKYRETAPDSMEDMDLGRWVVKYIDDAWPGYKSMSQVLLLDALLDARDRVRYACVSCGANIGDSPASDDPAAWPSSDPHVDDDAAWARIAAAHRPGCEWAATRAFRITHAHSYNASQIGPQPRAEGSEVVQKPDSIRWGAVRAILAVDPGRRADLRRFDRGLMPEDEQRERILDAALAPLARWGGFVRLLRGDVPHGPPCRQPLMWPFSDGACTFAEDTAPRLTAAEFAALEGIESALARKDDDPGPWKITVAPFALVATCTVCGATRSRVGIAATMVAGDWTLERRYAAEVPLGRQKEG